MKNTKHTRRTAVQPRRKPRRTLLGIGARGAAVVQPVQAFSKKFGLRQDTLSRLTLRRFARSA